MRSFVFLNRYSMQLLACIDADDLPSAVEQLKEGGITHQVVNGVSRVVENKDILVMEEYDTMGGPMYEILRQRL